MSLYDLGILCEHHIFNKPNNLCPLANEAYYITKERERE
jgi:hypothetical protein